MQHFPLHERFVLIAGSANASCKLEHLLRAHDFVRSLTRRLLEQGSGVVVFASSEPTHDQDPQVPLLFDWTVLREVASFLKSSGREVRKCVRVVTSNKAMASKLNALQREQLRRLSEARAADIAFIEEDIHTGGNIGDRQVELSHALVVISGGKGVTDRAAKFRRKSRPVVALDLDLGSIANDGPGGVELYRRCLSAPTDFLPRTGSQLPSIAPSMSLVGVAANPSRVAEIVADLLSSELDAQDAARPIDVLVLTALPVELTAMQEAIGLQDTAQPQQTKAGTLYWASDVGSKSSGCLIRSAIACFGTAGNVDAAAMSTELLSSISPRFVLMVGIAAGFRDRCRLGDVVLLDRLVAYEPSSVEDRDGVAAQTHRPDISRLDHATTQCVAAYVAAGKSLTDRVTPLRAAIGGAPPQDSDSRQVAMEMSVRTATIASGEKLLRSPSTFRGLRELHGKVEVVEMEGVGVSAACRILGKPFMVIRGISDHGDEKKDDRFHAIAAKGAAVVAVDFIRHGLRLQTI
jgi:nucleoside phosphorylase